MCIYLEKYIYFKLQIKLDGLNFKIINCVLWFIVYFIYGINIYSICYYFLISTLLVISIIDYFSYKIPIELNQIILFLGVINCIINYKKSLDYIIAFICFLIIFLIIYIATNGTKIGGGDVKLFAVLGFIFGSEKILYIIFLACIYASIVNIFKIFIYAKKELIPMGTYIFFAVLSILMV